MDYVNIFLTLPNPLNVYETNVTSPSPSPDSLNSENSMENSANFLDADCGDDSSESELTNLAWLTEIKNIGNIPLAGKSPTSNPTLRFNKFMDEIKRSREEFDKKCHIFQTNPHEKPPFNYAHIIGMAMMDKEMMTLKDICNWIKDNFAYYKYVGNWNNSIRHNLSLSVFFTKVARDKNEKGKGGYWKLAMDCTKTEKKRIRRNKNSNNSHNNNNHSRINNNNNLSQSTNNNNNNNTNNHNNNLNTKMPKERSVNQSKLKLKQHQPTTKVTAAATTSATVAVALATNTTSRITASTNHAIIDRDDGQIENETAILISSSNDNTNVEIVNGGFDVIVGGGGGGDGDGCDAEANGCCVVDEDGGVCGNNGDGCIVNGICDVNIDGNIVGGIGGICIVGGGNLTGNGDFVYNMDVCLNDGNGIRTDNFYETVAATEVITELNNLDHEIFLESDIPQPIDEIALPFVFNLPQNGPNVIAEAIPQFTNLPGLDSIDNSDFSSIKFNEYDELDKFLNCNQDFL